MNALSFQKISLNPIFSNSIAQIKPTMHRQNLFFHGLAVSLARSQPQDQPRHARALSTRTKLTQTFPMQKTWCGICSAFKVCSGGPSLWINEEKSFEEQIAKAFQTTTKDIIVRKEDMGPWRYWIKFVSPNPRYMEDIVWELKIHDINFACKDASIYIESEDIKNFINWVKHNQVQDIPISNSQIAKALNVDIEKMTFDKRSFGNLRFKLTFKDFNAEAVEKILCKLNSHNIETFYSPNFHERIHIARESEQNFITFVTNAMSNSKQ